MKKLLASLFGKGSRSEKKPRSPGVRLELLALEERANPSSYIANGDLVIDVTSASNVSVRYEPSWRGGDYRVIENGRHTLHWASRVTGGDVYFYGSDGHDTFDANVGLRVNAYGWGGNDTLKGGRNGDFLDGGNGRDDLYGRDGIDTLLAGWDFSYNQLFGGASTDYLYGGYGIDDLYGEGGNDFLYGSWGDDELYGGAGSDRLHGEAGNDYLNGGVDGWFDHLEGGGGADTFKMDLVLVGGGLNVLINMDEPFDYNPYGEGDREVV